MLEARQRRLRVPHQGRRLPLPISCTTLKAAVPRLVGQQPRNDSPLFAPVVETMTPVLQYPWSQKTDVDSAKRVPAEQVEKKSQALEGAQHWANEALRVRVAGKSQLRRSETGRPGEHVMACARRGNWRSGGLGNCGTHKRIGRRC